MEASSHCAERTDFKQVFVEHAPFVWRVLRRFGVAESDLPDACQDAFLVVHRKLDDFEGRSHLRTWLYRICARVASDYRKRAHRRYETEPLTQDPAIVADQLRTAELAQLCALLEHTLDGLDDDKRQVFVLYELEDLPMTQIAELLGCPLKTAFSRLYVARDRVNAALRRAGCAALIVALDPSPMRTLAQPPLAKALDATGVAAPSAAQLSTQLTALLGANASKLATTSASALPSLPALPALPAWMSTGALAVAAVVTLTLASAATPTPSVTAMPKTATLTGHAASRPNEPQTVEDVVSATPAIAAAPDPVAALPPTPRRSFAVAKRDHTRVIGNPAPGVAQPATNDVSLSSQWIEAPSATLPSPVAPQASHGTGLDEVLSATSIRPLMRVGPSVGNDSTDTPWALLPDAARAKHR